MPRATPPPRRRRRGRGGGERRGDAVQLTLRLAPGGPVLCRGLARRAAGGGGSVALPLPEDAGLDGGAVYERLAARQVELGPALRTIQRASWTGDHCLATLA